MGRWMIQGVLDLAVPAPTVGLPEPFLEKGAIDLSILDHRISRLFSQHGVQGERWPSGKRMSRGSGFPVLPESSPIHLLFWGNGFFYTLFLLSQSFSWQVSCF